MEKSLAIGSVILEKTAALAPMAGVGDRAMRQTAKRFGACYLVSEMISAKALTMGDEKTRRLCTVCETERPYAIQLFGSEPDVLAEAAALLDEFNPDIIDLNMGCPAPKIAGNRGGVSLMGNQPLAEEIVRAVKKATKKPVTVKFRKGLDEHHVNAVEFAKAMEQAGADAVTIHGRTKAQMYAPPVDLAIISAVKQAVSIPVIGNGGIVCSRDAQQMYRQTGCDLVMVGQGALGNPFLFSQIQSLLLEGEEIPDPDTAVRMKVLKEQISLLCSFSGEWMGMRQARKHVAYYCKGLKGAAAFRREAGTLTTLSELSALCERILAENPV